jgi:hypothetical protein
MRDVMGGFHRKILAAATTALALAAPAGAHAATHTLRPDATTFPGWVATPGGTASWEALNDSVFALTPPSTSSDYLSSPASTQAFTEVSLQNFTIPAGESVTGASIWVYAQTGTVRNAYIYAQTGATVLGSLTIPPGSPAAWYSIPVTAPLTQADADALKMGFSHTGTSGTSTVLYAAYLQVDTSDPDPPDDPPADDPPADDPPADDPPADDPPADDPPADDPPADDPPADDPPADDPPADDPPADDPPADDPPADPVIPPVDPTVPGVPPIDTTVPTVPTVPPADDDDPIVDPEDVLEPALDIAGTNPTTTASSTGVVPVALACPDTSVDGCAGVLWIEESLDAGSKSQQISSARRSPKRFSKPKKYKLRKGQRKSVPVRLDRRVHRKFKRKRSFKVAVVAQQKDSTGQVVTLRRTVRVFNTKKKKR